MGDGLEFLYICISSTSRTVAGDSVSFQLFSLLVASPLHPPPPKPGKQTFSSIDTSLAYDITCSGSFAAGHLIWFSLAMSQQCPRVLTQEKEQGDISALGEEKAHPCISCSELGFYWTSTVPSKGNQHLDCYRCFYLKPFMLSAGSWLQKLHCSLWQKPA